MKLIDNTTGIGPIATRVLVSLMNADVPCSDAELVKHVTTRTTPWYNGRENGYCLSVEHPHGGAIHIVFAECRNSDDIVVYDWVSNFGFNPPSVLDFTEETFRRGKYFASNTKGTLDACLHILALVEEHLKR